jgi:hypothetical protein
MWSTLDIDCSDGQVELAGALPIGQARPVTWPGSAEPPPADLPERGLRPRSLFPLPTTCVGPGAGTCWGVDLATVQKPRPP